MNPREFCRAPGYETAIVLTYSFDPLFFERIALTDFWAGGTGDVVVLADQEQIVESLNRWGGQVHSLGRRYHLVAAATSGSFHPKVMLRLGRAGGAIWVGSGNLTFGGWGANQELCCGWLFGPEMVDSGGWIGSFLRQVLSWCRDNMASDVIRRTLNLSWVRSFEESTEIEPAKRGLSARSWNHNGRGGGFLKFVFSPDPPIRRARCWSG